MTRLGWCGVLFLVACGSPSAMPEGGRPDGARPDGARPDSALHDGATVGDAASSDAPNNGDAPTGGDGTPMRLPCTNQFGNAMTSSFGRLDGILVSIVPPGSGNCNGDSSHVHLQIKANGAVYDVAVNVGSGGMQDVHSATRDIPMPGPAWAEGWHPNVTDDYVALGVHAADLPLGSASQLTSQLTTELASANHISVFATGYGPGGGHLVHRNGSGHDGLVITKPLSGTVHARLFAFSTQSF